MTIYSLKLSTENCGQTAADGNMVTIDILINSNLGSNSHHLGTKHS